MDLNQENNSFTTLSVNQSVRTGDTGISWAHQKRAYPQLVPLNTYVERVLERFKYSN